MRGPSCGGSRALYFGSQPPVTGRPSGNPALAAELLDGGAELFEGIGAEQMTITVREARQLLVDGGIDFRMAIMTKGISPRGRVLRRKESGGESAENATLTNPLERLLGYQLRRASQAMLSDFVSALEEFALRRSPADGRSHGLHLTAEGKAVVAKIRRRIADDENKFWKDTKSAEREALLTFLKSLWTEPESTPP